MGVLVAPPPQSLAHRGGHWHDMEDIHAVVKSFARRHIWIDGVKLIKATAYCHFGYLHTRDVITTVERVYANAMEDSKDAYLEFRCQFWTGPSARPRTRPFLGEKGKIFLAKGLIELCRDSMRRNSHTMDSKHA